MCRQHTRLLNSLDTGHGTAVLAALCTQTTVHQTPFKPISATTNDFMLGCGSTFGQRYLPLYRRISSQEERIRLLWMLAAIINCAVLHMLCQTKLPGESGAFLQPGSGRVTTGPQPWSPLIIDKDVSVAQ